MKKILKFFGANVNNAEKSLQFYNVDGFTLDMGEGHKLSIFQKDFPMYDRIFPFLSQLVENTKKYLNINNAQQRWIVDIGANVGDSAAAMIRHTNNHILCIEPTEKFFKLLEKNIKLFGANYEGRILLEKTYVALTSNEKYTSVISGGTAIRTEGGELGKTAVSLSNILKKNHISLDLVDLIKVDTDGFDSECIMSIEDSLKEHDPYLYWENQIENKDQLEKYNEMIKYLKEMKYEHFFLFDNFGNYICKGNYRTLEEVNDYLFRMIEGKSARTFYYVDILASKDKKFVLCEDIIKNYLCSIKRS